MIFNVTGWYYCVGLRYILAFSQRLLQRYKKTSGRVANRRNADGDDDDVVENSFVFLLFCDKNHESWIVTSTRSETESRLYANIRSRFTSHDIEGDFDWFFTSTWWSHLTIDTINHQTNSLRSWVQNKLWC